MANILKILMWTLLGIWFLVTCYILTIASQFIGYEELRWIFSSSAQSVAAIAAFLLAGYTLYIGELNKRVDKDETLIEIVSRIKRDTYGKLRNVLITSFLSVIFSLASIAFAIPIRNAVELSMHGLSATLTLLTLGLTLKFLLEVTRPDVVGRTATNILRDDTFKTFVKYVNGNNYYERFMNKFIELENEIREYAKGKGMPISVPVRYMFDKFAKDKDISSNLYKKTMDIIRFRNALVHTNREKVTAEALAEIKELVDKIKEINRRS